MWLRTPKRTLVCSKDSLRAGRLRRGGRLRGLPRDGDEKELVDRPLENDRGARRQRRGRRLGELLRDEGARRGGQSEDRADGQAHR